MEGSVSVSYDQNIRYHLYCSIFDKPVHCPTSLHLCREIGKGIKIGRSHSSCLTRFDRKMSFYFPSRVFALLSDRSVWHNGKHCIFTVFSPEVIKILKCYVTSFEIEKLLCFVDAVWLC